MGKFTERFAALRDLNNFTYAELGRRLGVTTPAVHDWATGRRNPTSSNVIELARIFNVDTDYLLGESDVPRKANPADCEIDGMDARFIELWSRASAAQRQLVEEVLSGLLEGEIPCK